MAGRKSLARAVQDIADQFWARVEKAPEGSKDCWIWTGKPSDYGYGRLHCRGIAKKALYAHRVAWELTYGPIPEGKHVLHHCDNPICARPDHLFLGDQAANNADCRAKGRAACGDRNGARTQRAANPFVKNHGSGCRGEKHPRARLSDAEVVSLRQRWAAGEYRNQNEAARAFGISRGYVTKLLHHSSRKPASIACS